MQKSLHLSYDVRNEIKKYFKGRRNLKSGCKIINNMENNKKEQRYEMWKKNINFIRIRYKT